MADLLNELQRLKTSNWSHTADSKAPVLPNNAQASGSDPLLLDEVYSVSPASSLSGGYKRSSGGGASAATAADTSGPRVTWGQESLLSSSSRQPTLQNATGTSAASSSVATSTAVVATSNAAAASTNSTAAAAVAAYRRQYLGLDCILPGGTAAGAQPDAKPSYVLKSRLQGKLVQDYGPGQIPGYLSRAAADGLQQQQQPAVPNLPAKAGTGQPLPPARLQPSSCCPPPYVEPLVPMNPDAKAIIAERLAERVLNPEAVINRLVYDSLQPPTDPDIDLRWPPANNSSNSNSGVSSARSTRSTTSPRTSGSGSSARDPVGDAAAAGARQAADFQYVAGLSSWYVPQRLDDPTLVFESRFESGNLRRAVQVYPFEYDLILQPDINTRGHTQWYYFAVLNTRAGQPYRFNVINLLKEDSLYNMGMLPLMHSEQQMRDKGIGWFRTGCEVYYGPNTIKKGKGTYYTLTFTVEFPHDHDLVHLAHCYPYTYTDLQHHLHVICKEPSPGIMVERSCLATTLAGNAADLLTITAAPSDGKPLNQRQGVVLSARVHPGETNASWMMKGALHQLLADSADSRQLRENFVFKVVPMLNPDGVIVGNYRCSLAGLDLNRVWQDPDSKIQPVVRAYKDMIKGFTEEREVVMFCDMHGHSRKYGVFIYGCEKKPGKDDRAQGPGWPVPGTIGGLPGVPVKCQPNIFPLMLYLNAPDLFSYRSCNFKVQKSKAGTGRVVGFKELGLVNAFTIEASFCGAAVGKYAKQHFNTGHLEDMGAALVRTLLDYWAPADTNSAADLAAQLTGTAGNCTASAAAAQSALGLLLEMNAGGAEDDDACTDSDDESSDDEPPPAAKAPGQRLPSSKPPADEAADVGTVAAAAAQAAAEISSHVAQISNQLVAMLVGAAGSPAGPAGVQAAAASSTADAPGSAVAVLLSALKQQQSGAAGVGSSGISNTAKSSPAASAANSRRTSKSRNQSSNNLAGQQQQQQQPGSLASSPAAAAMAAASAAQQLLDKVKRRKSRLQDLGASNSPAGTASAGTTAESGLLQRAGASSGVKWSAESKEAAIGGTGLTRGTAGGSADVLGQQLAGTSNLGGSQSSGQSQQQLSQEEAALLGIPGFIDLLQQLVDEQAALNAAVATAAAAAKGSVGAAPKGGKKKGRRKQLAKYGNPEVLRAERAKADATLAAALPALGVVDDDAASQDDPAADDSSFSDAFSRHAAGPLSAPPSAGSDGSSEWSNQFRAITAGRRANVSAGRGSKSSMLDAERYMTLLDKQKRHTGGVLASSSIDNPWEGESDRLSSRSAFSRGGWLLPGNPADNVGSNSSANDARMARSVSSQVPQQFAAAASNTAGRLAGPAAADGAPWGAGANQTGAAAEPGATGISQRRRSKSMQLLPHDRGMWHPIQSSAQGEVLPADALSN